MTVGSGRHTSLLIIAVAALLAGLAAGGGAVALRHNDKPTAAADTLAAEGDGASDPAPEPASDPASAPASDPAGAPATAAPSAHPAVPSATAPASARRPGSPPSRAWVAPEGASTPPAGLSSLPPATKQLIVVSTNAYGDTTATLSTYTKSGRTWSPAFPAMTARIGTHGFSDNKTEGDGTTPTGLYSLGATMYGVSANPGVHYAYHGLVAGDYWNENPATAGYNTFVHGANPGAASEALWTVTPQYNYFAVINYNIPVVSATPARGSGIFLHVMSPGHATAGCVSLAQADLVKVLTWLNPGSSPRIVMAPAANLHLY